RHTRFSRDWSSDVCSSDLSFSFLFHIFPIKKNKIVICNFYGRGYGDNGKYIVEEILKENKDYDVVWLLRKEFRENSGLPTNIRRSEERRVGKECRYRCKTD